MNNDGFFEPPGEKIEIKSGNWAGEWEETRVALTNGGFFIFENVPPNMEAVVHVWKEGFAPNGKRFEILPDRVVKIILLEAEEIDLDEDLQDGLQASLKDESGKSLVEIDISKEALDRLGRKPARISVTYLDPLTQIDAFPGDFLAETWEGEVYLATTILAEISMWDEDGMSISRVPAKIRIKIPKDNWFTLEDRDPSTEEVEIEWWYFDEGFGVWRMHNKLGYLEDSEGRKIKRDELKLIYTGEFEGDLYARGDVSHFTWWNVDIELDDDGGDGGDEDGIGSEEEYNMWKYDMANRLPEEAVEQANLIADLIILYSGAQWMFNWVKPGSGFADLIVNIADLASKMEGNPRYKQIAEAGHRI